MALDTRLVPLSDIQGQFWDKLTDAPIGGGTIEFFSDLSRTTPKNVYVLTGSDAAWTYTSIGSTITLSSIGTLDDGAGNNIVPYLYPYTGVPGDVVQGTLEYYYIVVKNSDAQAQFTVVGTPNVGETAVDPETTDELVNFIPNGQFLLNDSVGAISAVSTDVAYGGWRYIRSVENDSTDSVTFERFDAPIDSPTNLPTGNPRYELKAECTSVGTETYKYIEIRFDDVNRFSDPTQILSVFFTGINNASGNRDIEVNLRKHYGAGGSVDENVSIGTVTLGQNYSSSSLSFAFNSNAGKTLGANDDDYFSIQLILPHAALFDISVTDFVLYLGDVAITAYPFTPNPVPFGDGWVTDPTVPETNDLDSTLDNIWTSIGDASVTDPTISAPNDLNTTLSNMFLAVSPNAQANVTTVVLDHTSTAWQDVTGAAVALSTGKYLVSYAVTHQLGAGGLSTGGIVSAWAVYNSETTSLITASSAEAYVVTVLANNDFIQPASVTFIMDVTTSTTLTVQATIDSAGNLDEFVMRNTTICAVRLSG